MFEVCYMFHLLNIYYVYNMYDNEKIYVADVMLNQAYH